MARTVKAKRNISFSGIFIFKKTVPIALMHGALMGKKPEIRFTLFEILPNIILKNPNNEKRTTGVIGTFLQDMWERTVYKSFNYSLNWVQDGQGAGKYKDGAYTGLLGMLQRNETDSCPIPYGISVFDGTVQYSHSTNAMDGRILNSPNPKWVSLDLLSCYQCFNQTVWLTILMLTLVAANVIWKLQNRTVFDAIHTSFALFLNKDFPKLRSLLFQLFVVGSLILCLIFTQSMNADLLKKDYTPIIDSLDDLNRQPEVRPVFIDDGAIVSLFEDGVSPTYAQIWARAKKAGSRDLYVFGLNPTEYSRAMQGSGRLALISTEPIIKIAASFGCQKNPKRRSWIASKPLQETLFGHYMNVNLNRDSVAILNKISEMVIEGGHANYGWNYAGENVVKNLLPASVEPLCIKKTIEDLFVESEKTYSITLSKMIYFLLCFVLLLALGIAALHIERMVWRVKRALAI